MGREITYFDPVFTAKGAPVISTQPQGISAPTSEYLSAYEPIVYDLTWTGSSDTTLTNVRMEAVVEYGDFVGASEVVLGTQYKKAIDVSGTTTYRFDFSDMLKTILNPEFWNNISNDIIQTGNYNILNFFRVKFTSKYNDAQGVERTDTTLTSSVYRVINTIIPLEDTTKYITDVAGGYTLANSTSNFLTKAPNNKTIYSNESEQLNFLCSYSYTNLELNYQTYDLNGSANAAQTKALVDCSTTYNGAITITDNGVNTLIDDFANISKIDVWIEDNVGTVRSETRTYLINQGCSNGYRLWWHNSLGGVDRYTFDKYKNKTFEQSERMVYQKPLGTTPTSSDISAQTYSTKGNYKYIAVSEFKSSDLEMFVDLINSTEVYYEVNPTELIAVVITSATQAVEDSEGMIQVQIEFEPSQMKKTHIA